MLEVHRRGGDLVTVRWLRICQALVSSACSCTLQDCGGQPSGDVEVNRFFRSLESGSPPVKPVVGCSPIQLGEKSVFGCHWQGLNLDGDRDNRGQVFQEV